MKNDTEPRQAGDLNANISKVVRVLLVHNEIRQQDLAVALDRNPASVTRALKGERPWTIDELGQMAALFDVPIALFFEPSGSLVRSRCFPVAA